jgi:simple sugar transport system ATP-binding protein
LGEKVTTVDAKSVSPAEIANLMVGRKVLIKISKKPPKRLSNIGEIKNLSVLSDANTEIINNLSLNLYGGEILGLAGVEGNGQSQLIECICGLRPAKKGDFLFLGKNISNKPIAERRGDGLAYIPPDRRTSGVAEQAKIFEVLLADRMNIKPYKGKIFLRPKFIQTKAKKLIHEYGIKAWSVNSIVSSLSGGNIQKVVLAREISSNPKLLIASEPSTGIDIAATEFVHRKLMEARDKGAAILLLSSDLDEMISLSDRIAVIYKGEIVAIEPNTRNLDKKQIGRYMLGVEKQPLEIINKRL